MENTKILVTRFFLINKFLNYNYNGISYSFICKFYFQYKPKVIIMFNQCHHLLESWASCKLINEKSKKKFIHFVIMMYRSKILIII